MAKRRGGKKWFKSLGQRYHDLGFDLAGTMGHGQFFGHIDIYCVVGAAYMKCKFGKVARDGHTNGFDVIVTKLDLDAPKLQIDPTFQWMTEGYRNQINAELREMFGVTESVIADYANRRLYVSERTARRMKGGEL